MEPLSCAWWVIQGFCQALIWFSHDIDVAIFGFMLLVCHFVVVTNIHFRNMSERWK